MANIDLMPFKVRKILPIPVSKFLKTEITMPVVNTKK